MGMISFLKEAGEKLFGGKPAVAAAIAEPTNAEKLAAANQVASEAIKNYINSQNLPGNDLTISYNGADQIVTVSGKVASQEIREKIVICCGNVSSVAGVADNMESPPEPESTYHTVERGDTLSAISKKVYGNANLYNQIFEANRPMLSHPDKIYPGQVLHIPAKA